VSDRDAVASDRDIAREVLSIEAEAIRRLAEGLDEQFDAAVEMINGCQGRVIVTGMGKTGIIGRKIAATLASTGTPAYFVHPEEALHGDLGMIVRNDIVLALSSSGETEEVLRVVTLIETIKKIGARIIAMTGNGDSTLASHSDIVINIAVEREAGPMNLVPTASTTAALAMGDALAVALLCRKGFSPEDYAFYHPGGSIGRKLLKIRHVMRRQNVTPVVHEDAPIMDALHEVSRAHAGTVSVVDSDGRLVGVFSDGDLRRSIEKDESAPRQPIGRFMTRNPTTVTPEVLVAEALRTVKDRDIGALIVVDPENRPIGIVDERDLLGLA
jgi:arabinose-5-phosphate isomerase